LEAAVRSGWMETPRLETESTLEPLRNEPRFRRIAAELAARSQLD